jgi:hypothetical protein
MMRHRVARPEIRVGAKSRTKNSADDKDREEKTVARPDNHVFLEAAPNQKMAISQVGYYEFVTEAKKRVSDVLLW